MTRIDVVPAKQAGPLVRLVYRLSRRQLGRDVDPVSVYAHLPRLLIGYGMFEQATAKQHRVEERLKALAETKAAAVVNCEFCCDIASSIAREAGVTEEQLLALPRYRESDEFTALDPEVDPDTKRHGPVRRRSSHSRRKARKMPHRSFQAMSAAT